MGAGRWLRNRGFAFTEAQILNRWDDLGGPRGLERWALQSRARFVAGKLVASLGGLLGLVISGWWLWSELRLVWPTAVGWMLGTVIIVPIAAGPMWRRQRALYDRWLRRRERQAAAGVSGAAPPTR